MTTLDLKNKILEIITTSDGKYASSRMIEAYFRNNHPNILVQIFELTKFYSVTQIKFSRRIQLILEGVYQPLTCSSCGGNIDPNKRGEKSVFLKFCSGVCAGKGNLGNTFEYSTERKSIIDSKRTETMLKKYGTKYNSQRPEVKEIITESQRAQHKHIRYDILDDKELLLELYKTDPSTYIAIQCKCDYSAVLDRLKKYGADIGTHTKISAQQLQIADIFRSFGVDIVMNDKTIGIGDIDVYAPEHKFGIEYNGFPWHLENFSGRGSTYHLSKTLASQLHGIKLLHVAPHHLTEKLHILTSIIGSMLGKNKRIYGRKCVIREIDIGTAKIFLDQNHLNGYIGCNIRYGVFYNDELVHVMSFVKSRYDTTSTWEIARSASLCGNNVVGIVSKCISKFMRDIMSYGEILMTYADRSISNGNSYSLAGMVFDHNTSPNYWYTCDKYTLQSRMRFQKHKLKDLPIYDSSLSEWENMKLNGYDRYWDCGNAVYKMKKGTEVPL